MTEVQSATTAQAEATRAASRAAVAAAFGKPFDQILAEAVAVRRSFDETTERMYDLGIIERKTPVATDATSGPAQGTAVATLAQQEDTRQTAPASGATAQLRANDSAQAASASASPSMTPSRAVETVLSATSSPSETLPEATRRESRIAVESVFGKTMEQIQRDALEARRLFDETTERMYKLGILSKEDSASSETSTSASLGRSSAAETVSSVANDAASIPTSVVEEQASRQMLAGSSYQLVRSVNTPVNTLLKAI